MKLSSLILIMIKEDFICPMSLHYSAYEKNSLHLTECVYLITWSNCIEFSVLGHCENRGCEVLLGDQAHIFLYEQAGMAQVSS